MPTQCAAFGCTHKGGHVFPKEEHLRKQWIAAVKRSGFVPSKHSVICANHFLESDYYNIGPHTDAPLKNKRLKKNAVPSVFSWKRNLNKDLIADRASRREVRDSKKRKAPIQTNMEHLDKENDSNVSCDQGVSHHFENTICMDMPSERRQDAEIEILPDIDVVHEETVMDISDSVSEPVNVTPKESNPKTTPCLCCSNAHGKGTKTVGSQASSRSGYLSHESLKNNPKRLKYFTGLETYSKFMLVLNSLGPAAFELTYRYGAVDSVCVEDQFLMTVVKLRRAMPYLGISMLFDVSTKTVENIVVTWLNFMYLEWSQLDIWPCKELIQYFMPEGFKQMYPSTRVIIDGTEFPIPASKNPAHQQATFSVYKNRPTLKCGVGCSPSGLISYVSPAYAGSVSDRAIVERSDLFQKCDPHDSIMADRGFTVQDLFAPYKVAINIPAFLKGKAQLPGVTLLNDRKLAIAKGCTLKELLASLKPIKF